MKIVITGANGFLGSRLCEAFLPHVTIGTTRKDFDIENEADVQAYLQKHRPDVLIHCAALSDVTACQDDPDLSYKANVLGTKNIASACAQLSIKLVFCSSDQVYVGLNGDAPHKEDEDVSPPHIYGQHKVMAENHCLDSSEDSVCLRLAWMYDASVLPGQGRGGIAASVMDAIEAGQALRFPDNDFRSITNVWEVAEQMGKALSLPGGVYNFGSKNDVSTYDVVSHLLKLKGLDHVPLMKIKKAFPSGQRNIRMDPQKAQALGIEFYSTLEGLSETLTHLL